MSGALALAASIAAMTRAEVRALVGARRISSPDSVHDPLGLALELLRPESMSRALSVTDRSGLHALQSLATAGVTADSSATFAALRQRGLVGIHDTAGSFVALPEVSDALERALAGIGMSDAPPSYPATSVDTSRWFGEAITAVRCAAALLRVLIGHPARLSRKGTVTAAGVRALAEAIHSEQHYTGYLLTVLQHAGLVAATPAARPGSATEALTLTDSAHEWLAAPYPERWLALAQALADRLNPHLRHALNRASGDLELAADTVLPAEFPLLPDTAIAEAREYLAASEAIGFTAQGHLSPPAIPLLAGNVAAAHELATRDLPAPATGVYVQPDLTIVVPGPLLPADEQALSEITETEQLGAAAVLRVTLASLSRARQRGHSTQAIRALLDRLSLTGIPQPLDFMLTDLDRAQQNTSASTPPDDAWLTHADAHTTMTGRAPVRPSARTATARDHQKILDALADRVFDAAQSVSGAGNIGRKLELAIRDRAPVVVTAAAGSDERVFTLLPVALTAGRLRATDQVAGVERTLPLSAIVSVTAAPA